MINDNIYYLYILASKSGTLYVGVTNDLPRRVSEHKNKLIPGFTKKYDCIKLIYYEPNDDIYETIRREKEIKAWRREKKVRLIREYNPKWCDLAEDLLV